MENSNELKLSSSELELKDSYNSTSTVSHSSEYSLFRIADKKEIVDTQYPLIQFIKLDREQYIEDQINRVYVQTNSFKWYTGEILSKLLKYKNLNNLPEEFTKTKKKSLQILNVCAYR